jgi:hypothetical protein
MYASGNPKTKKELKEWVAAGRKVEIFSPGPFPAPINGWSTVEGPHYPKPHRFYAQVFIENGLIVKVK